MVTPFKQPNVERPISQPERPAPPAQEQLPAPERERLKNEVLKAIEAETTVERPATVRPAQARPPVPAATKSQTLQTIERVLEEDLQTVYFKLEPSKQQEFKTKGEQTAAAIEQVLLGTKDRAGVKAKRILTLIIEWLKIIPGVNRFFIKQEAKIKTDKILKANLS